MVRERVKNRTFTDAFLVECPPEAGILPLSSLFPDNHPLEVDVGCGRGRFLLARARNHPGVNYLGIDKSLLRLRKIDRKSVASGILNIRLINAEALHVLSCLPAGTVTTIYVFYPDPWPKRRHHPRRLVSPAFIDLVFQALSPGGMIHLCTDHSDYFQAITRSWGKDPRFSPAPPFLPAEEEQTDFELIFNAQHSTAHRCSFQKQVYGG
jgi:tRNA (guanine-N(7)-)-methyltransferase